MYNNLVRHSRQKSLVSLVPFLIVPLDLYVLDRRDRGVLDISTFRTTVVRRACVPNFERD